MNNQKYPVEKVYGKKKKHSPQYGIKNRLVSYLFQTVVVVLIVSVLLAGGAFLFKDIASPKEEYSLSIVDSSPKDIPDYKGEDSIILNDNIPNFTDYDLKNFTGESYSNLDRFGRCGTAMAQIDRSMMPMEERGKIGNIKPTGWIQNKYEGIIHSYPPYLYNRCHLIAFALTGQNDNEKNLITGTRYMNAQTMLSYEKQVMHYLDNSDNHILYRVSPYFKGKELVARGVEIEALSVEDQGESICFHVFVYNVQPGIEIDYLTGENRPSS